MGEKNKKAIGDNPSTLALEIIETATHNASKMLSSTRWHTQ